MKKIVTIWLLFYLFLMAGCTMNTASKEQAIDESQVKLEQDDQQSTVSANEETNKPVSLLADSLDTAVVEQVNEDNHRITFWNLARGLQYTLEYDSATGIKDRYDNEMVASQLESGDVVKVAFVKDEKKAKHIWIDKAVTKMDQVTKFDIHSMAQTMDVEEKRFALDTCVSVLGDQKQLTLMDINEADTLTVYALDHTILSLVIANGHGYVRLEGAESFEGGFVEFGQSIIKKVEKDTLFVLPVGHYSMLISHAGKSGTKEVDVLSEKETTVDVSDLIEEEQAKEGGIVFTISPADALLFLDGKETEYSDVVKIGYGIHQMKLKKEGYKTISQYIKVGAEMANIDIEMEKSSSKEEEEDKDASSVSNNTIVATKDTYQVYIDAPVSAELYVDGKYVGIVPTSFEKKTGSHTISLRKSGYITRSYSLDVDDSKKDVHYTFSQLQEDMTTAILDYTSGLGL